MQLKTFQGLKLFNVQLFCANFFFLKSLYDPLSGKVGPIKSLGGGGGGGGGYLLVAPH